LQGIAGAFDVSHGFCGPRNGYTALRSPARRARFAAHEVFVDVHQTLRRGIFGSLFGECRLRADRHQQPAPQRQP
jgi:hypothetical protein